MKRTIKFCLSMLCVCLGLFALWGYKMLSSGKLTETLTLANVPIHAVTLEAKNGDRMLVVRFFQDYALAHALSCRVVPYDPDFKSIGVEISGPGASINSANAFTEASFDTAFYAEPMGAPQGAVDALTQGVIQAAQHVEGLSVTSQK